MEYSKETKFFPKKKKKDKEQITNYLTISGDLKLKHGLQEIEFRASNKIRTKKGKKYPVEENDFFDDIKDVLNPIFDVLTTASGLKQKLPFGMPLTVDTGNTSLALVPTNLTRIDDPDNYGVLWNGDLSAKLSLFDGAGITVDIVEFVILYSTSGFGPWLADIRREFEKGRSGVKGELTLDFTVSGGLNLDITAITEGSTSSITGGANGIIGMQVVGKINGRVEGFGFYAEAGAEVKTGSAIDDSVVSGIKGEVSFSADDKGALKIDGVGGGEADVKCTGLTLYYALYADFGHANNTETERKDKNRVSEEGTAGVQKKVWTGSYPLIEEFSILEALGLKDSKKER